MGDLPPRICALAAAGFFWFACVESRAQDPKKADLALEGAVITKLAPLTYPRLALQTRISGDVEIRLEVQANGSVATADVVRGHPLLSQAALENAKQSQFECNNCGEGVRSFRMVYTFELGPTSYCTEKVGYPRFTQSKGHVTVVDEPIGTCDPAGTITYNKVRSVKCLYLWKCAKPRVVFIY
jgi:TonB family protein